MFDRADTTARRRYLAASLCPGTRLCAFALAGLLLISPALTAGEFSLKDMAGKTHALPDYQGKWVLVNFWATWCPPCLEEIPDLIALHDQRKDLVVLGVVLEYQNEKEVRQFADDNLISYPIVLGGDQVLHQFGSTEILPMTYIYNPQGRLVKMQRGLMTRQQMERATSIQ